MKDLLKLHHLLLLLKIKINKRVEMALNGSNEIGKFGKLATSCSCELKSKELILSFI